MMYVEYQPFSLSSNLYINNSVIKAPSQISKLAMTIISTACDLDVGNIVIKAPTGFYREIEQEIKSVKENYCPDRAITVKEYV